MKTRQALRHGLALVALAILVGALFPAVSSAGFSIKPGSIKVQTYNAFEQPDTRAGAHPDNLSIDFKFVTSGGTGLRDLGFEFGPGLTGFPLATKTCDRFVYEFSTCPEDTEVGIFRAAFLFSEEEIDEPIYNITPGPGQVVALAFKPTWETELEMTLRPEDFGLDITTEDLPQLPFNEGHVELWGVPADHNGSSSSGRSPFLTTPSECGPMKVRLYARSWEPAAPVISQTVETEPYQGCQSLPFEPSLAVRLSNAKPDSPTGAELAIDLPEHTGADEQASASLKNVRIELPPSLTVSPGGVEGRAICEDGQFGLGSAQPATCPFASRVGTVEVDTPQLARNLVGSIYLGHELPGERFRLFIAATAPGVSYKAIAKLATDNSTGRLSTILDNLPQFAAKEISLNFDGGSRALLATSLTCGASAAKGRFESYAGGPPVDSVTSVKVGSGSCAPSFSPGLIAGSTNLKAGQNTGFELTLSRQESEQIPGKFSTTLPPGLTANLNSVGLCSDGAANAGSCPDSTRIGNAVAEVGSGPNPAKVPGSVYLTGPYKGAPFGVAIVFRAAIGPFDLGTLTVRATLKIDPHTGQVTIEHLLPSIFEGVPLRFRTIGIDLNREGFLVNPTSCESEQLVSTIFAVDGRTSTVSDPFHVNGCEGLQFKPKFSVALNQKGKRAKNPQLSFAVSVPKHQANLERLKVKFPSLLKFHNAGLKQICTRGDAAEDHCPAGAKVGTAVARSPIVSEPLRGPVYVVQPKDKGFPDLWSNVEGQGVKLQLRSESTTKKGGSLISEMVEIPDLPLESFTMSVNGGGKKGALFSVGKEGCGKPGALSTAAELEGHNGAVQSANVEMKAGCSKSARKQRAAKRQAHHRRS
jgi:hypothetical protein